MAQRSFEIKQAPVWVKVISVCFILYGLYIMSNAVNVLNEYDRTQELEDIIDERWEETIHQGDSTLSDIEPTVIMDSISNATFGKNIFNETEEIKTWEEIFSMCGIGLCLCFILYGVALFVPRKEIITVGVILLVVSAIYSLAQAYVYISDWSNSFLTMFAGFAKLFGLIPDAGLLIFLLVSNKSFYEGFQEDKEDDDLYEIEF